MFKVRSAVFLIAALLCETGRSAPQRPITVNEAQELVRALLKPDGWTKLRGFVLYQALFDAEFQDFYFIHAEWGTPPKAIGHYAVERSTGEVWDWVRCGKFNSASLTAAQQAAAPNTLKPDQFDYQHLHKSGPFCEPNEQPQKR